MSGAEFKPKDEGQLAHLLRQVGIVGGIPREAGQLVGAAALDMVTRGYETESDPYGRKWKPQRCRPGGQTLSDTGRLKNSWRVSVTDKSVRLVNATRYAEIHQYGGIIRPVKAKALRFKLGSGWVMKKKVTIPQRMQVPTNGPAKKWEDAFADELKAYLDSLEELK